MVTLTKRLVVGRELTHAELDNNFTALDTELTNINGDLDGAHAANGAYAKPIFNQVEESLLMDSSMFEYLAEIIRSLGGSGVLNVRNYLAGGTQNYHKPQDISYAPLNIHNHPNYLSTCGMAEFTAAVNGYYIRTRHNDYKCEERGDYPTNPGVTKLVTLPGVPTSVTAAGIAAATAAGGTAQNQLNAKVAAEVAEMQLYFKAFNDKNTALKDYRTFFRWNLAYMEVWLDNLTPEVVDAFTSNRHAIDASSNRDLIEKALKFNYSGHKNRAENIPFFSNVVRFVDNTGQPKFARLNYRILVKDLGPIEGTGFDYHPKTICHVEQDEPTKARFGPIGREDLRARFRVDQTSNEKAISTPELLDTFMGTIAGIDGYSAPSLEENYTNGAQIDRITDFGTSTFRNSKFYNRYFSMTDADAAGRTGATRGFNDPTLWVARTENTTVVDVGVDNVNKPYRFSYAIPIELVLRTPLQSWNPYSIPVKTVDELKLENTNLDSSTAKIFSGYNEIGYFHLTPASFFTGNYNINDPANTDASSITYVSLVKTLALGGTANSNGQFPADPSATTYGTTRNSGMYIILPPIVIGAETINIRSRYPCYPKFGDASYAGAETSALWKHTALRSYTNNQFNTVANGTVFIPLTGTLALNDIGLINTSGVFTLPTDLNGYYDISASAEWQAGDVNTRQLALEVSTNGGSTWSRVVGNGKSLDALHCHDTTVPITCSIHQRLSAATYSGKLFRFTAKHGHTAGLTLYFEMSVKYYRA